MTSAAPQRKTITLAVRFVGLVLAIASILLTVLFYQATRDIAAEKANVTALKVEITKEMARSAALKSDLDAAQQALAAERKNVESEKSKTQSAQAALHEEKSRLPPLPVRIDMRRSLAGRGLVAMFNNTSALQLSVVMGTLNPTTRAATEHVFQIAPGKKVDIGHLEGVQFASGDEIRLRSAGFEEMRYYVQ